MDGMKIWLKYVPTITSVTLGNMYLTHCVHWIVYKT